MSAKTVVLDHDRVQRKLERIAHQLHEENHEESGIVIVGVAQRGYVMATRLADRLQGIVGMDVVLAKLTLDKEAPLDAPVKLSVDVGSLRDRVVVLVDDVLMSGRTLMHAAAYLVQVPLKKLTTVVLVDRRHRTYPIRADIVGLTLSSTMQEHISVELGRKDVVYIT